MTDEATPHGTSNQSNVYIDQEFVIDDNIFRDCAFRRCRLIYRGGKPPVIERCTIIDTEFAFEGAASRTVQFLSSLAKSTEGGDEFVVKVMLGLSGWAKKDVVPG